MTPEQLRKFKTRAKVYKMTLQDYANWLLLFESDPEHLAPRHLTNLRKIEKGETLTIDDIPRDNIPPPLTAQQYFDRLSDYDEQMVPQNLETTGLQMPANYGDYSTFETPRNLKHLDDSDHDDKLCRYSHRDTIDRTRPKISHEWDN